MSWNDRLHRCLAVATSALAALASVQANAQIAVESSPFLGCLATPPASALAYPRDAIERRIGGTLRVRLVFSAATEAPRATVSFDSLGDPFRSSVLDFVDRYRMPCLPADAKPVEVSQEFQFVADDGRKVVTSPLRDETPRPDLLRCLQGAERVPDYAGSRIERDSKGAVFVSMTFSAPDQPPQITTLYRNGGARFERVVRDYVGGYRLPCLSADRTPLQVRQWFRFQMQGDGGAVLKDASLPNFIRAMRNPQATPVRFDFQTMGCPFDVRLTLFQPLADNGVGELERHDPNRREFIEWLRRAELALPEKSFQDVIGETMTISVPCMIVDLL